MKVGSIVECVNASNQFNDPLIIFPNGKLVQNETYEVSGFGANGGVKLVEKPVMFKDGLNIRILCHKKERFREILPDEEIEQLLEESSHINH